MPNVAGLTPVGDRPDMPTRRVRGRVQVNTNLPSAAPLRAVATPADTYVRPPQPQVGSDNASQLVKILSSIQPSLENFMTQPNAAQKKAQEDAEVAAIKTRMAPMSYDERTAFLKSGDPLLQSVAARETAAKSYAITLKQTIEEDYAQNFDPVTGDVDTFIQAHMAKAQDEWGQDELSMSIIGDQLHDTLTGLRDKVSTERTTYELDSRKQNVFTVWQDKAKSMGVEGVSPTDTAAAIFQDFGRNRDFLRLDYKEQQGMVMDLATSAAADGNLDLAEALLRHPRSDGAYSGTMLDDVNFSSRASGLLDRIGETREKNSYRASALEAEAALSQDNDLAFDKGEILFRTEASVPDETGNLKTVTVEEQTKATAARYIERSARIAAEYKETPEQTFDRELAAFSSNGAQHPNWTRVLNNGLQAANTATTNLENLPPALEEGYELFRKLNAKSPAYLSAYLKSDAAEFYEAVRVYEEELGYDRSVAMNSAADLLSPARAEARKAQNIDRYALQEQADKALDTNSRGFWGKVFGSTDYAPVNGGEIKSEVSRYATLYMATGLPAERALELAGKQINTNYVNIRGSLIKRTAQMPEQFGQMVELQLQEYVAKYGEDDDLDIDDLTIRPLSNGASGQWMIYDRVNNRYMRTSRPESTITYRSLIDREQARRTAAEQAVLDRRDPNKPKPQTEPYMSRKDR